MDKDLELIYKKISLKKILIENTGKTLEELESQKTKLSKKEFEKSENEIIKEFNKSLKAIDKIKN